MSYTHYRASDSSSREEQLAGFGFSLKPPKFIRKMQPGKILKKIAIPLAIGGALFIPGVAPALAAGGRAIFGVAKAGGGAALSLFRRGGAKLPIRSLNQALNMADPVLLPRGARTPLINLPPAAGPSAATQSILDRIFHSGSTGGSSPGGAQIAAQGEGQGGGDAGGGGGGGEMAPGGDITDTTGPPDQAAPGGLSLASLAVPALIIGGLVLFNQSRGGGGRSRPRSRRRSRRR